MDAAHNRTLCGEGEDELVLSPLRAHASLALNSELNAFDNWAEETFRQRGQTLFAVARKIWRGPLEKEEALIGQASEVSDKDRLP